MTAVRMELGEGVLILLAADLRPGISSNITVNIWTHPMQLDDEKMRSFIRFVYFYRFYGMVRLWSCVIKPEGFQTCLLSSIYFIFLTSTDDSSSVPTLMRSSIISLLCRRCHGKDDVPFGGNTSANADEDEVERWRCVCGGETAQLQTCCYSS